MTEVGPGTFIKCLAVSAFALALSACAGGGGGSSTSGGTTTGSTLGSLSGSYVFSVVGTDASDGDYAVLGRFVADGSGNITSGVADYSLGSGVDAGVPLTGTYSMTNGVMTVHLTDSGSIFDSFTASTATTGTIQIENFDGTGSGTLYPQTTSGFTPLGAYSFSAKGEGNGTVTGSGNFLVPPGDTFSTGVVTYTDGSTQMNYTNAAGFVAPPQSNGRGQAALVGNNLAYYVISPTQVQMIGLDERALLLLTVQKQ